LYVRTTRNNQQRKHVRGNHWNQGSAAQLLNKAPVRQQGKAGGEDQNRHARNVRVVMEGGTADRQVNRPDTGSSSGKILESREFENYKEVHAGEQQSRDKTRSLQGKDRLKQPGGITEQRRMNQIRLVIEEAVRGEGSAQFEVRTLVTAQHVIGIGRKQVESQEE
jgi:hypothetical protein